MLNVDVVPTPIDVQVHKSTILALLGGKCRLMDTSEAHDLAVKLIEAISNVNGLKDAEDGKVLQPKPIPSRSKPPGRKT